MKEPTAKFGLSRSVAGALFVFGLMGAVLFAVGRKDYPDLHIILDTGLFLLSGILALLLRDMGRRINNPLPKHLAVSFAATALLNFIHVMITVECSGSFAPIAQAEGEVPRHVDRVFNKLPKLRDLREALAEVTANPWPAKPS